MSWCTAFQGPRVLREGDVVSLDCGTVYQGYYADSAITVGVGEISDIARRLLTVTEQALQAGIAFMRPGNRTGDVTVAMQEFVEFHGFYMVRNYTSHGIGRNMHEDPELRYYVRPGSGTLLRPGHDYCAGADGARRHARNADAGG
jgi:methionyl aminopeptidase